MIPELKQRLADALYPSTTIWDGDWDVCLVLDGCRADTFQEVYPDAGEAVSVASSSKPWIQRTFADVDPADVGYITANPFSDDLDADDFALFEQVPVRQLGGGLETVPPTDLRDRAIQAWRSRDETGLEQLIVHFMQPHVPFRSRPEWFSDFRETDTWGHARWKDVGSLIEADEWMRAYRDNLAWVVDKAVAPLRFNLDGEVLVTADHGNACGEWGEWGHPNGALSPAVRLVPWYTFPAADLRELNPSVEESDVWDPEEQLDALGYV